MSLWGGKLQEGKPIVFENLEKSLSITRVALASGESATLSIQMDDSNQLLVGKLTKDNKSSMGLDINIWQGSEGKYTLTSKGDGVLHLIGYYHPSESYDTDDDDDIGSEEEEEEAMIQSLKKQNNNKTQSGGKAAANAAAAFASVPTKPQPQSQPQSQPQTGGKKGGAAKKGKNQAGEAKTEAKTEPTPTPAAGTKNNNNKKRKASPQQQSGASQPTQPQTVAGGANDNPGKKRKVNQTKK